MAKLEKVLVNGESIPLGSGMEGRINSSIERNGASSCVVIQVGFDRKSYSYAFPAGCAGRGDGGSGGSVPAELTRLNEIYQNALDELKKNSAFLRKVVRVFVRDATT